MADRYIIVHAFLIKLYADEWSIVSKCRHMYIVGADT